MARFHSRLTTALVALFLAAGSTEAQDNDTVIQSRDRRPLSVVDQIADPAERKVLLTLYGADDARERLRLATAFVANYPRSWLLAQAYEIAAKASIDLGDYDRALDYGRRSLKIFPENPLLLVPLANVYAQRALIAEAKQSARDALECLKQFGRPAAIPEPAWPDLERQLKASSYFVLGRATASEALALAPGLKRKATLEESLNFLLEARALNAADPEIAYLTGLNYLALGQTENAAISFAAAYQLDGALKSAALAQLQKLYQKSTHDSRLGFENYVEALRARSQNLPLRSPEKDHSSSGKLPEYAGSEACRSCHEDIYRAWSHTGTARMLRPYRPEMVIGDFEKDNDFYQGDEVALRDGNIEVTRGRNRTLFARLLIHKGRPQFVIRQSDGQWHRYPVDYTIGSKWQQAYATRLPSGQIHVFPVQYNALHKRWINFWKIIDVPGSERADLHTWEKLDALTSYEANCAACHTSQLRNTRGGGFEPDNLAFREPGINCEMCHGPSARHISSVLAGKAHKKKPLDPPVDFNKISDQDSVAICAQCHMQSALREPGANGELNYVSGGRVFFPHFKARPYAEFSIKARYKDGRFRETTFMVESLLRTACFRKGGVTCVSCHDPHPSDASTNKTSLKFANQADQMCLQCHTKLMGEIQVHTRHPAQSEASRCVSCHMPRIMNALLFRARSHQIDDIPDAETTLRFGQADSPAGCLLCHKDKGPEWLKQQLLARSNHRSSP